MHTRQEATHGVRKSMISVGAAVVLVGAGFLVLQLAGIIVKPYSQTYSPPETFTIWSENLHWLLWRIDGIGMEGMGASVVMIGFGLVLAVPVVVLELITRAWSALRASARERVG